MSIIKVPHILLPRKADLSKWATVACDQFCAEPKYWKELQSFVGEEPSTLNITFPEIHLGKRDEERINGICATMREYIDGGLFENIDSMILVERELDGEKRVGIVAAVDLDAYDWRRVKVPVRATEDTIIERLPIRLRIRENAPVELPHVIMLIDDAEKNIIEPLYADRENLKKLYDFELNMGGGRIRGYEIKDAESVAAKMDALLNPETQGAKYGTDAGIMLAVGDGNHSVAAAKVMWEKIKAGLDEKQRENHPARFVLTEIVNIYGGGMNFDAIHRVIFNAGEKFVNGLKTHLTGTGTLKIFTKDGEEHISAPKLQSHAIADIQNYIEQAAAADNTLKVEYVHNEKRLRDIVSEEGGVGIVMPKFPRAELFNYVVNSGNLPKKAFSIGEPEHKRYYLEAKFII